MRKMLARAVCHLSGNRSLKKIQKSDQLKVFSELKRLQWNSLDENINLQKNDLYGCVVHAIKTVPYYRGLGFSETDFSIETIFDDIKKLPLLTKDIIRREGSHLLSEDYKGWTYKTTSGGTTGEPVPFIHSARFFDYDQGGKILFDTWAGREIGDSQIRLWGSERDIITGKKDKINKIYRWLKNEKFINTFSMTDKEMRECIDYIKKRSPRMMLAYVQSAREIAQYAKKNGLAPVPIKCGVMTSAGTLDQSTYELLKNVYKAPVLNRYGSREASDMACSCDKNEGLHINMKSTYIEILGDDGKECEPGDKGRIVVTSLVEDAMPLIRFDIGDYGAKTSEQCSCGRGWELLKSVNGRIVDVFKTHDGKKIDGEYFTHLFYTEGDIKQFQVVQEEINRILVKIVPYDKTPDDVFMRIESGIHKVMGEETLVEFQIVDEIPPSQSGKRIYTISLV